MTRNIITADGIRQAEQVGSLFNVKGFYFFESAYRGGEISELSTGFALPGFVKTEADAHAFAEKYDINMAVERAKKILTEQGIEFPLNRF